MVMLRGDNKTSPSPSASRGLTSLRGTGLPLRYCISSFAALVAGVDTSAP
jgi:hypothetical protein